MTEPQFDELRVRGAASGLYTEEIAQIAVKVSPPSPKEVTEKKKPWGEAHRGKIKSVPAKTQEAMEDVAEVRTFPRRQRVRTNLDRSCADYIKQTISSLDRQDSRS